MSTSSEAVGPTVGGVAKTIGNAESPCTAVDSRPVLVSGRCLNCVMATHPIEPEHTPRVCGAVGVLARMQGQVADLARTIWAARQPGELMDTVAEIETLKTRL